MIKFPISVDLLIFLSEIYPHKVALVLCNVSNVLYLIFLGRGIDQKGDADDATP